MGKEQTLSSAAFFYPKEKVLGSKPASCKIRGRGFLFEEETEGRDINGEREKRGGGAGAGASAFTPLLRAQCERIPPYYSQHVFSFCSNVNVVVFT